MRNMVIRTIDDEIGETEPFQLVVLVDREGRFVLSNSRDQQGERLPPRVLKRLPDYDYQGEAWFQAGLEGRNHLLDQHVSPLWPPTRPRDELLPDDYHFGCARPVFDEEDPERVNGVLLGLVNWRSVQDRMDESAIKEYFQGLVGSEVYPSAYGWIWRNDADTIIAHPDHRLYQKRVSADVGLPQMVEAARAELGRNEAGLFPEYSFNGRMKNAAFKFCAGPDQDGFGWLVGVGIDNDDIYKGARELRGQLIRATALVLLVAILWTMVISRRITAPILALREQTVQVAGGNLDARVTVHSGDELGELADAFNDMTAEIKQQREELVRAEKDAAWREMARQVAHDIKNPLTPIQLSADLLKRAKDEDSPEFDRIFDRTVETVSRQVQNLREIASDFHALTGASSARPESVDVGALVDEVLELNAAWADEIGVRVSREGNGGRVFADPKLLRRVLINLVSNAFEAMPEGGELCAFVDAPAAADGGGDGSPDGKQDAHLLIEVRDTGVGVPAEVRARLFEPYFTTRSHGTGLGLAIAKRIIEEMDGTIELVTRAPDAGTTARIRLPLEER